MRAYLYDYDLCSPSSLPEVLSRLDEQPGRWKVLAGGTDVMVLFEAGELSHTRWINLWGLKELRGIEQRDNEFRIGALNTFSEIRQHSVIQKQFPLLVAAAREIGAEAIQNRATIGGNIANASPAADSPPALLVYDADIELMSLKGVRRVAYQDFHRGYKQMDLKANEIISALYLPLLPAGWRHYYRKVGTRKAQAITKVGLAALIDYRENTIQDIRLSMASVAPIPLRLVKTETALKGKNVNEENLQNARQVLEREIVPIDDIRSTQKYRRRVAANLVEYFLHSWK
jgi:CO/xanthine dehydrogenase FAD-binding subunit